MASPIALHEAQQHLPDLFDRAERGEEIVIEREGHASMKLVPMPIDDYLPGGALAVKTCLASPISHPTSTRP